jgi:hypothetical protein
VEIDPTLLVRLGTPDRFRPNDTLVEPMLTTTTSKLLIYINVSVFIENWMEQILTLVGGNRCHYQLKLS